MLILRSSPTPALLSRQFAESLMMRLSMATPILQLGTLRASFDSSRAYSS
jgi:hypothetical protein